MRWMVEGANPTARAIERRLQCVASRGVVSSVRRIVSATSSSPIRRGAPGRGSSRRPSIRRSANRRRHLPTVLGAASTRRLMSLFSAPSAAKRTMRARCASPCAVFRRDAKLSSSRRSLCVRSIATAVFPIANSPRLDINLAGVIVRLCRASNDEGEPANAALLMISVCGRSMNRALGEVFCVSPSAEREGKLLMLDKTLRQTIVEELDSSRASTLQTLVLP